MENRGAPESSVAACRNLERPDSFLVIAGQQAGLLSGPLYTVYKVATAVALAKKLSSQRTETFLPCFWCASEDHDYDEIRSLSLLDTNNKVKDFRLPDIDRDNRPVYEIPSSTCSLEELTGFLGTNLRATEFTPWLLDIVRETHGASATLSDWMARFLWSLFPDDGLLILFPEDGFYQREGREILLTELEHPEKSGEAVRTAASKIEDLGLTSQIHKAEGRASFFLVDGDRGNRRRVPVMVREGRFSAEEESFDPEDFVRLFDDDPIAVSAGAALRPVLQDAAYPNVLSILGPGELNYHAQIGEIYRMHGIERPAFSIRLSATVLPARLEEWLNESGFALSDFQQDTEWLVRETVRRSESSGADEALEELRKQVARSFHLLEKEVQSIDPSLEGAIIKNRKGMEKQLDRIESLLNRRRAQNEKALHRRMENLQAHIYPNGKPQERVLNIFTYLNLFGGEFLNDMKGLAAANVQEAHFLVSL
jgi:bacillithiol biosynthesis cysteine-adding enzyme BshC